MAIWAWPVLWMCAFGMSHASFTNNRRAKMDREWKSRRRYCEKQHCNHLGIYEGVNCINECTSQACYHEVYSEPLEDGEVDREKQRQFINCIRKEIRTRGLNRVRREARETTSDLYGMAFHPLRRL